MIRLASIVALLLGLLTSLIILKDYRDVAFQEKGRAASASGATILVTFGNGRRADFDTWDKRFHYYPAIALCLITTKTNLLADETYSFAESFEVSMIEVRGQKISRAELTKILNLRRCKYFRLIGMNISKDLKELARRIRPDSKLKFFN